MRARCESTQGRGVYKASSCPASLISCPPPVFFQLTSSLRTPRRSRSWASSPGHSRPSLVGSRRRSTTGEHATPAPPFLPMRGEGTPDVHPMRSKPNPVAGISCARDAVSPRWIDNTIVYCFLRGVFGWRTGCGGISVRLLALITESSGCLFASNRCPWQHKIPRADPRDCGQD